MSDATPLLKIVEVKDAKPVRDLEDDKPYVVVRVVDDEDYDLAFVMSPGWAQFMATEMFVAGWEAVGTPEAMQAAQEFRKAYLSAQTEIEDE